MHNQRIAEIGDSTRPEPNCSDLPIKSGFTAKPQTSPRKTRACELMGHRESDESRESSENRGREEVYGGWLIVDGKRRTGEMVVAERNVHLRID